MASDGIETVRLGGKTVRFRVRRSARARHIGLRFTYADGLVVVLPRRAPERAAAEVLREKRDWVLKHNESFGSEIVGNGSVRNGMWVLLRGEPHRVLMASPRGSVGGRVCCSDHTISLATDPGDDVRAASLLESWLREQARGDIHSTIARLDPAAALGIKGVRIRDQKTRWGSCSASRVLSFNWRLVKAPPGVLDYVVAHELAHVRHTRHSRRFWSKVAALFPGYEEPMAWLSDNGLHLWRWEAPPIGRSSPSDQIELDLTPIEGPTPLGGVDDVLLHGH